MDAGAIWFQALSGAGRNIASGIDHYQQQQDQISNVDAMIMMGSQMQIPDANGQAHPLIDPKMVELWASESKAKKAHSAGAMQALLEMQMGMAHEGAKARIATEMLKRKEGLIEDRQKRVAKYRADLKGGGSGVFEKSLQKYGLTPDEFNSIDEDSLQYLDKHGEKLTPASARPKGAGKSPEELAKWRDSKHKEMLSRAHSVTGTVGDKTFKMSMNDYHKLKNQAQTPQTAGSGGGIPRVSTVKEALSYPPGTLVMTPIGIRRVPGKTQSQSTDEPADDSNGEE